MNQSTLFISSIILMVAFSAFLLALRKVIGFIESRDRNFDARRRTYRYERYSREICGCLATAGLMEIALLGISLPIMDHKIVKMCDDNRYPADCAEVAIIWQTITFTYCGITVLIGCILIACLARIPRNTITRPRRLCFQPLVLTLGHLLLQLCAILTLIVSCSDFVFQRVTMASKRDASIVMAACAILVFEISVAVWLYGTTVFFVETSVLASRRRRNPQARVQEVGIDMGVQTEGDESGSEEGP